MSTRQALRRKLEERKQKNKLTPDEFHAIRAKAINDAAIKKVFTAKTEGKFDDLKYVNFTQKQFYKFLLLMAKTGNVGRIGQDLVDSFAGILDLYDTIPECLKAYPDLSHDGMLEPLTYLFKCRDDAQGVAALEPLEPLEPHDEDIDDARAALKLLSSF
jgi:hypothetical protein